jgi:hypothetical protein
MIGGITDYQLTYKQMGGLIKMMSLSGENNNMENNNAPTIEE